ncbi:MAG: OsmC family protein [Saprospiraceae bacterium]|nr:OsmC family protein [Saprospiraceae bacterium]
MPRDVQVILGDEDFQCTVDNGNSQWLVDEPVDKGGQDTGPTPSESVMGGLGACIAITLQIYARHKGWDLGEVKVDLHLEGTEPGGHPRIHRKITVQGDFDEDQKSRLLKIAGKCPVSRLISGEVPMTGELIVEE